jgi:hypothetical protein
MNATTGCVKNIEPIIIKRKYFVSRSIAHYVRRISIIDEFTGAVCFSLPIQVGHRESGKRTVSHVYLKVGVSLHAAKSLSQKFQASDRVSMLQVSKAVDWIYPCMPAVSVGDGVTHHGPIDNGRVESGRSGAYSSALGPYTAMETRKKEEKNEGYFQVEFDHDCLLNSKKLHFSQKRLNGLYMLLPFFDIFCV